MHRTLNDHQRRVAFAVVAVVVVAVMAGVAALTHGHHSRTATTSTAAAATSATQPGGQTTPRIVDSAAVATSSTASTSRTATTSTATTSIPARPARPGNPRRLILTDARAFLSTYLMSEAGSPDARMRARIRATTTPAFARRVLRAPVALPGRSKTTGGRVQTLEFAGEPGHTTASVTATIQKRSWVSGLTVGLRNVGGRWLVNSLS